MINNIISIIQSGSEETVTSSEFERFLAERAAAAEALPSTTDAQKSARKGSKEEKELLALWVFLLTIINHRCYQ